MIRRLVGAAAVLVVALGLAVLAWPELFGLQRTQPVAQAVSFRAVAAAAALVAGVVATLFALLVRATRVPIALVAVLLLAFAATDGGILATRGLVARGFEKPTDSSITVLSWNTLGGAPGAERIAEVVAETKPDVIALPETTEETADEVAALTRQQGLDYTAHTVAYDEISPARSTSLLLADRLGPYTVASERISTQVLPSVVAVPDGDGPTIVAAHAVAPTPGNIADWRTDLDWLAEQCAGPDVVIAGDFNATLDHFAGLETARDDVDGEPATTVLGGCRDAGLAAGSAALGTWPSSVPALLGTAIDHVLATPGWRVSGYRVLTDEDGSGSDHRPILAQLTPAG